MENIELEEYLDELENHAEDMRICIEELIDNICDIKDNFFFHDEDIKVSKQGNISIDTSLISTNISNLEALLERLKDELTQIKSS